MSWIALLFAFVGSWMFVPAMALPGAGVLVVAALGGRGRTALLIWTVVSVATGLAAWFLMDAGADSSRVAILVVLTVGGAAVSLSMRSNGRMRLGAVPFGLLAIGAWFDFDPVLIASLSWLVAVKLAVSGWRKLGALIGVVTFAVAAFARTRGHVVVDSIAGIAAGAWLAVGCGAVAALDRGVANLTTAYRAARERWIVRAQVHRWKFILLTIGGVLATALVLLFWPVWWIDIDPQEFESQLKLTWPWGIWGHPRRLAAITWLFGVFVVAGRVPGSPRRVFLRPVALGLLSGLVFFGLAMLDPSFGTAVAVALLLTAAIPFPRGARAWTLGLTALGASAAVWEWTHFGAAWVTPARFLVIGLMFRALVASRVSLRATVLAGALGVTVWPWLAPESSMWLQAKMMIGDSWEDPIPDWAIASGRLVVLFVFMWPFVVLARALGSATAVPLEHPIYADFGGPKLPSDDPAAAVDDVSPGGPARSGSTSPG